MRLIQPAQTRAVKASASATAQVSSEMRQPVFCMALCAKARASSETISCSLEVAIFDAPVVSATFRTTTTSNRKNVQPQQLLTTEVPAKIKNPLAGFGASERAVRPIAIT
jgi:hypothetical protein